MIFEYWTSFTFQGLDPFQLDCLTYVCRVVIYMYVGDNPLHPHFTELPITFYILTMNILLHHKYLLGVPEVCITIWSFPSLCHGEKWWIGKQKTLCSIFGVDSMIRYSKSFVISPDSQKYLAKAFTRLHSNPLYKRK